MSELTISGTQALEVAAATVAIYLVSVGFIRVLGQRGLVARSTYEVPLGMALGAVIGRTALLEVPTLGAGVVALAVLFSMQRVLRALRRCRRVRALLDRPPVLLMSDGRRDAAAMRRAGVSADDLRQALRLAGISRWESAGRVVLERNGEISVIRRDPEFDDELYADVS